MAHQEFSKDRSSLPHLLGYTLLHDEEPVKVESLMVWCVSPHWKETWETPFDWPRSETIVLLGSRGAGNHAQMLSIMYEDLLCPIGHKPSSCRSRLHC